MSGRRWRWNFLILLLAVSSSQEDSGEWNTFEEIHLLSRREAPALSSSELKFLSELLSRSSTNPTATYNSQSYSNPINNPIYNIPTSYASQQASPLSQAELSSVATIVEKLHSLMETVLKTPGLTGQGTYRNPEGTVAPESALLSRDSRIIPSEFVRQNSYVKPETPELSRYSTPTSVPEYSTVRDSYSMPTYSNIPSNQLSYAPQNNQQLANMQLHFNLNWNSVPPGYYEYMAKQPVYCERCQRRDSDVTQRTPPKVPVPIPEPEPLPELPVKTELRMRVDPVPEPTSLHIAHPVPEPIVFAETPVADRIPQTPLIGADSALLPIPASDPASEQVAEPEPEPEPHSTSAPESLPEPHPEPIPEPEPIPVLESEAASTLETEEEKRKRDPMFRRFVIIKTTHPDGTVTMKKMAVDPRNKHKVDHLIEHGPRLTPPHPAEPPQTIGGPPPNPDPPIGAVKLPVQMTNVPTDLPEPTLNNSPEHRGYGRPQGVQKDHPPTVDGDPTPPPPAPLI